MDWSLAGTTMLIVDGILVASYLIFLYIMKRLLREQLDHNTHERSPPHHNAIFNY